MASFRFTTLARVLSAKRSSNTASRLRRAPQSGNDVDDDRLIFVCLYHSGVVIIESAPRFSPMRRVKREAGENPARSRHCEQRAEPVEVEPLFLLRNGKVAGFTSTCESGDLPWRRACTALRLRASGDGRRTMFGGPRISPQFSTSPGQ